MRTYRSAEGAQKLWGSRASPVENFKVKSAGRGVLARLCTHPGNSRRASQHPTKSARPHCDRNTAYMGTGCRPDVLLALGTLAVANGTSDKRNDGDGGHDPRRLDEWSICVNASGVSVHRYQTRAGPLYQGLPQYEGLSVRANPVLLNISSNSRCATGIGDNVSAQAEAPGFDTVECLRSNAPSFR